jgi:F0F1-type ATP synthase delta subunit
LRINDLQYDASVATQLNNLEKELLNTNIKS